MGVDVIVPDVNESHVDFIVREGKIRFGLSAVRNVGEGVVEKIIARAPRRHLSLTSRLRQSGRRSRARTNGLSNRWSRPARSTESDITRKSLFLAFEEILEGTIERRRNEDLGQYSLFGADVAEVSPVPVELGGDEWSPKVKLAFEKEMLGLYVSDHPLLMVGSALAAEASPINSLSELADRSQVTIGGLVGSISRRFTQQRADPLLSARRSRFIHRGHGVSQDRRGVRAVGQPRRHDPGRRHARPAGRRGQTESQVDSGGEGPIGRNCAPRRSRRGRCRPGSSASSSQSSKVIPGHRR